MKRIFRGEWFHLSRSPILWVTLAVILVVDVFLSSRTQVTTANLYDLPRLCTTSQFTNYADNASMSARGAVNYFQGRGQLDEIPQDELLELYENDDIIGVFQRVMPYQFRWILAAAQGMLVIPLLLAIVFLSSDLERRCHHNPLYAGLRRSQIFTAKALYLFIVTFVISLAGICLLTGVYASAVFKMLPAAYVWSRLLLHALADTALIAPAYLLVVLIRKTVPAGILIIAYDLLLRFSNIWPLKSAMSDMTRWEQNGNPMPILLWSVGILTVCVVLSWLREQKASLQ